MNRLFLTLVLLLSLLSLGQVVGETLTPKQTNERIEALTKILGPELGSLLDDAEAVFTIAGLQPSYLRAFEGFRDGALLERAQKESAKLGLILSLDETGIQLDSTQGLERFTSRSRLPWLRKFKSTEGHNSIQEWYKLQELPSSEANSFSFFIYLQKGAHDAILESLLKTSQDPSAEARELPVTFPFAEDFRASMFSMMVLPEFVDDSFRDWHEERAQFAAEFYQLPEVRNRMREVWWRQAREQHSLSTLLPKTEHFLLRKYSVSSVPEGYLTESQQELVLLKHAEDWARLIRSGAPPAQWLRSFLKWSGEDGLTDPVSQQDLEGWLWGGALESSASRTLAYRALKEVQPNYFHQESERRLRDWLEIEESRSEGAPEESDGQALLLLFSHPEVKNSFSKCPPELRSSLLKNLKSYLALEACSKLLRAAPYGM